ncbi:MAG TPA: YdeI/OmpD-associated family protein [Opitutaceae bacterium]|nr:YdeI/OmpD-associated family protein [Opitutaceae bacterium]
MRPLRFRSVIEINGINPYVLVSAERAARLRPGWRRPLPVRVRVNGEPKVPWRINLMPVGDGGFYLYLHGAVRKTSKTKVGDAVTVELEFDDGYRGGPAHPMPAWFRQALEQNRSAKQAWSELIPSRKKEILRYFAGLKSAETQARNLQRAIHVLGGGKARFMGRSWNEC